MVKDFHGNTDVVFGDVTLSKNQVRSIHGEEQGAGAGGWPTVRHFNKETGYGGKKYEQQTSEAMCTELGPGKDYLHQHIESAGGTSLCSVKNTESGCSEEQTKFIAKWGDKSKDDLQKQLDRLTGMVDKDGASMKPDALSWAKQRLNMVKQLHKKEEL